MTNRHPNKKEILELFKKYMSSDNNDASASEAEFKLPKKKRIRRKFTVKQKLSIVEKVLAGDISIYDVRDENGELIHYGTVQQWILSYQAGRFKGVDPNANYISNFRKGSTIPSGKSLEGFIEALAELLSSENETSTSKKKDKPIRSSSKK